MECPIRTVCLINGYSGHATREDIRMDLREMMNNAKNDKERLAIQQFLDSWKDV